MYEQVNINNMRYLYLIHFIRIHILNKRNKRCKIHTYIIICSHIYMCYKLESRKAGKIGSRAHFLFSVAFGEFIFRS